jgi:hypothetical protein
MAAPTSRARRVLVPVLATVTAIALTIGLSSAAVGWARHDAAPSHEHLAAADVHAAHGGSAEAGAATVSKRAFHDAMRELWEEHVTWTRLFIVSFVADLPDLQATTDRLLRNQVDIGDAVAPFYGRAAADQLTDLLTEHIATAAEVLTAAMAGDAQALDAALADWYANARQIARFLHAANPRHWPLADLRHMMRMHLDLTLQEASDQLTGDYAASVADFDAVEAEILEMADTLSSGIIAQFPSKFS